MESVAFGALVSLDSRPTTTTSHKVSFATCAPQTFGPATKVVPAARAPRPGKGSPHLFRGLHIFGAEHAYQLAQLTWRQFPSGLAVAAELGPFLVAVLGKVLR